MKTIPVIEVLAGESYPAAAAIAFFGAKPSVGALY